MKAFKEICKFAERVGIAVGEVYFVALPAQSDFKSEVVVISNAVRLVEADYSAWTVLNIFSAFVPLVFLALLGHAYAHPVIVKTLWLCKITNVESYYLV